MFPRRAAYGLAVLSILAASHRPLAAQPPPKPTFSVEEKSDRLIITDGGRPVAEYVFNDPEIKRPYFRHVHTPSGIQVTRTHPPVEGKDLADHPTFHPGIWWGFGEINGEDFWRNKGTIRHERFDNRTADDGAISIRHYCSLVDSSGTVIGKAFFFTRWHRTPMLPSKRPSYWVCFDVALRSDDRELVLGDQEEMGLGIRLATQLAEKNGGLVTGHGDQKGAKSIWGTRSTWCDYSGRIDERQVGVTVVNRLLSWWHVRDYGLLVVNGFGKRAQPDRTDPLIRLPPRTPWMTSYQLIIHDDPDYDPKQVVGLLTSED
jgi:hypothetical protein